jgi:hypothetical protein
MYNVPKFGFARTINRDIDQQIQPDDNKKTLRVKMGALSLLSQTAGFDKMTVEKQDTKSSESLV